LNLDGFVVGLLVVGLAVVVDEPLVTVALVGFSVELGALDEVSSSSQSSSDSSESSVVEEGALVEVEPLVVELVGALVMVTGSPEVDPSVEIEAGPVEASLFDLVV